MTYKDILDQIQGSGQSWSQWDLDTAKAHPEFGASMLSYKSDWYNAKDQAGRTAANAAAENLRRQYGNYLGGPDGSKYYGLGASPGGYQSGYKSRISEILDKMGDYGEHSYDPAPVYDNRYQQKLDELLGKVQSYGPFSWSKETDPSYSAYAKQYRREGQRATQDALAQAAAMTGGNVSSAAMTAASQAGDYYAGQLADKIPELYENAYQRYLSQYQMLADQLSETRTAEQADYAKYLDRLGQYNTDRSYSYNQWLDQYNMLGSALGAYQGQDQTEYQRLLDQVDYDRQNKSLYQQQVDAILAAGGAPSAALVGQSGYGQEYVNALKNLYRQQAAAKAAKSSGGGSSDGSRGGDAGGDGGGDGEDQGSVYQRLYDSGIMTEAEAYEALMRMGYSSTQADKLAGYFGGLVESGALEDQEERYYSSAMTNQTEPVTPVGSMHDPNPAPHELVHIEGMEPVTWQKLAELMEAGKVEEIYDRKTNTRTYVRTGGKS